MEDNRSDAGSGNAGSGHSAGAGGPQANPHLQADEVLVDPAIEQAAIDGEFELFYLAETPKLIGFLMVRGSEAGLAADIAQETMLEAYRRWNDIEAPRAWIRRVARRRWAKLTEKRHREEPAEQVPEPSGLLSPDEADLLGQRHDIIAVLAALPDAQREVMAFSYDGYQPNEIAGLLGKPAATVRSLLRQARATLRDSKEGTG
ncbi:sigma-70 family RNA polymerase sigma factor [Actinoplanes oblitus]|uniref:Sigma-70 family RNA polymerase sigma factor n=1 Tax=Actinoplanes oblitus TaxID=3040509 RepID=A0ABY8WLM4_9ACTN|nr:sigma-70 family RNA polymerase sigma factor [Actinoplanes oblitus]WIM98796.1 sigma-70 family RNA polymerase sigma factor [Actinoplanes oblitus]